MSESTIRLLQSAKSSPAPTTVGVGIDYGATYLRGALVDNQGHLLHRTRQLVPVATAARVTAPAELATRLLALAATMQISAAAVGLAVAGTVRGGTLTWSAHLGLAEVPFGVLLQEHTGLLACVINDAHAAGYAEAATRRPRGLTLYISVGSGIGGALVSDGQLIPGLGHAGEIGHMVIDPSGPPCTCGRSGCWEQYAGGRALDRAAASLLDDHATAQHLVALADAGDSRAQAVLASASGAFAAGVDNLCAILSPDQIILGGGIISRGGTVARRYQAALSHLRWPCGPVTRAVLGDDAGCIGAGLLAIAATVRSPELR